MRHIGRMQSTRAVLRGIIFVSVKAIYLAILVPLALMNRWPSTAHVFMILGFLNSVRLTVTVFIPAAFATMGEARVTIARLQVSRGSCWQSS